MLNQIFDHYHRHRYHVVVEEPVVYLEGHIRVQPADRYCLGFRICYQNLLRHVVLDLDLVELLEGLPSVHIVVFVVIPPSSSSSFNALSGGGTVGGYHLVMETHLLVLLLFLQLLL